MANLYKVANFYHFIQITDPARLKGIREQLLAGGKSLNLKALIILAREGINGTVAGIPENVETFKSLLNECYPGEELLFKDNFCKKIPLNRMSVKIKDEIVTSGMEIDVNGNFYKSLSPKEWHEMLIKEEVILLDTRNKYEVTLGKFKGATDFEIDNFSQFGKELEKCGLPREKKLLMYCTGGVRCEKALPEALRQGFKEVYQLRGGILKYIEEYPSELFEGECFVFDNRVAVDQQLKPTEKYRFCVDCGDPTIKNERFCAKGCEKPAINCDICLALYNGVVACSKNCRHHLSLNTLSQKDAVFQVL